MMTARFELIRDNTYLDTETGGIVATRAGQDPLEVVLEAAQPSPLSAYEVDQERDRRMAVFPFGGKLYQLSGESLANVQGAGTLALAAIFNGAAPGNYRWADPDEDFSWIANDNTSVLMDAQTAWAFAQAAASWRKQMIYKARALKDMGTIPTDYANDSYWL